MHPPASVRSASSAPRLANADAKIVGPSVGPAPGDEAFDLTLVTDFIDVLAERELRIDALSWHEFFSPKDLVEHVAAVREYVETRLSTAPATSTIGYGRERLHSGKSGAGH